MRKTVLTALFGVAIFLSKGFLPTPIDKMLIAVQALFLALGALMANPLGAAKVSVIGAILTAILRPALAPLTIIFALVYGILTDLFVHVLRVKHSEKVVRTGRLVAATTISTAITGLLSYYFSAYVLRVMPLNPLLDTVILAGGILSGLIGGYLAAITWRKVVKNLVS